MFRDYVTEGDLILLGILVAFIAWAWFVEKVRRAERQVMRGPEPPESLPWNWDPGLRRRYDRMDAGQKRAWFRRYKFWTPCAIPLMGVAIIGVVLQQFVVVVIFAALAAIIMLYVFFARDALTSQSVMSMMLNHAHHSHNRR